ncbi:MAG: type II secretion system F family protein [Bdellovibrionales bacterium]|nr:type II secretion system F family protein [Bdellovibrionales bacterium]
MATFKYQAKALGGRVVSGEIEAADVTEARVRLRSQRLMPTKVEVKQDRKTAGANKGFKFGGGVPAKELQIVTRQFATLINSGIPIVQSLQILSQGRHSPNLQEALESIKNDVESGKRLAEAMAQFPKIFDTLYTSLVRAGEEGGVLDTILNRLAIYIEKANKIISKVKSAMFYPIGVLAVSFIVITGILTFVIPKFEAMFSNSGQKLPALTQIVIDFSHWFKDNFYLPIGGIIIFVVGIKKYYESPNGREVLDAILIRIPLLGDVIQKAAIARFSRTLSTMLSSGVSIMDSLDIAGQTIGNSVMEKTVRLSKAYVQEGKSMVVAFSKDKYFPDMVVQMIGVGEQTGALDNMLGKIADFYEEEVDYSVGALTSMIEPIMMVFLGGIIAVLVIAMYLPVFNLAGGVG